MGKYLIFIGIIITFAGIILALLPHLKISLGRLPGDIMIQRKNFAFYFPITTSIIISIILTIILHLFFRK